ncbi:hypothetical protein [Roseiterribacter gracilis]|uniref:Uncharacterized protein n=1 Tax=Roseiterribacter gracilis TaxID=2812848 RepID=A0A8S8XA18_9PROT|nr:hypothetical protein TMPK1_04020 [Rhodospirillales bacterium TMPK1]
MPPTRVPAQRRAKDDLRLLIETARALPARIDRALARPGTAGAALTFAPMLVVFVAIYVDNVLTRTDPEWAVWLLSFWCARKAFGRVPPEDHVLRLARRVGIVLYIGAIAIVPILSTDLVAGSMSLRLDIWVLLLILQAILAFFVPKRFRKPLGRIALCQFGVFLGILAWGIDLEGREYEDFKITTYVFQTLPGQVGDLLGRILGWFGLG